VIEGPAGGLYQKEESPLRPMSLSIFVSTPLQRYAFHLQCWGCSSSTLFQGSWFFFGVWDC
jgi:hypothetical protein